MLDWPFDYLRVMVTVRVRVWARVRIGVRVRVMVGDICRLCNKKQEYE